MPQVLTLTPAPALDVTLTADSLASGASHRVAPATYRLGGKGLNVANILAVQGVNATAMGLIARADVEKYGGNGYPKHRRIAELHPALRRRFTDTTLNLRSTWSIYSERDGDTAMFNEPGQDYSAEEWDRLAADVLTAVDEDARTVVTVSGSVPSSLPQGFLPTLLAQVIDHGGELIADTQGQTLLSMCELKPLWVKPNRHEIADALGHDDVVRGAKQLRQRGAKNVAVSLGSEGLLLVTSEDSVLARLDRPMEGNPTGAGDAVVAALAASALTDSPLESIDAIARRCVAWSAAAVLAPVAGEISSQWHHLADKVIVSSLD